MDISPKDIRLEVRIKNNLIMKKVEERCGDISLVKLAEIVGTSKAHLSAMINFKILPVTKMRVDRCRKIERVKATDDGLLYWREAAINLSYILGCDDPLEIFPERLWIKKARNKYDIELDSLSLSQMLIHESAMLTKDESPSPFDIVSRKMDIEEEMKEAILKSSLDWRERQVLRCRLGANGDPKTYEECSAELYFSVDKVKTIERQALRKLRRKGHDI